MWEGEVEVVTSDGTMATFFASPQQKTGLCRQGRKE